MCKFESSQKDESRWQSTDSSKAYRNTSAFKNTIQYVEKYTIDDELEGHVHKLHVKLHFVWEWLFSVCCGHACYILPLWCELTNNTLRKQSWLHFFPLKLECHNSYNKLLLFDSANGDIA